MASPRARTATSLYVSPHSCCHSGQLKAPGPASARMIGCAHLAAGVTLARLPAASRSATYSAIRARMRSTLALLPTALGAPAARLLRAALAAATLTSSPQLLPVACPYSDAARSA